jgi:flavin-binding protein dodecin
MCRKRRANKEERAMGVQGNHIYRITKLVGTSTVGFDEAVKLAVERAQKTLRHVLWFEVKEQRGRIIPTGMEYQVTLEIGFLLEE